MAEDIFKKICPDQEFIPKVPNPEDIIFVRKDSCKQSDTTQEVPPEKPATEDAPNEEAEKEEEKVNSNENTEVSPERIEETLEETPPVPTPEKGETQ